MRKTFVVACGSLLLSGLIVAQSWAGSFSSDLACLTSIKKGRVKITANGDVKGFIKLLTPLTEPLMADCIILCNDVLAAGPSECINAKAGATKLKIKAPGLGASLDSACFGPAVGVGAICESVYVPPGS